MDKKKKNLFEARARILKAMAHPSRLFIVDTLAGQERCVQELAGMLEVDVSTVSRHLSVLKNAGLVKDEKDGTKVFYRLSVPCVLNFFSCVESVLETRAREQADLVGKR
ncbi:MAG: winged helix-turn-helix transcriptional regulator [Candidatus Krumholzibacteriota bacterium]|nr:winged helix-turn-helix transcriptional regulator [Candidatus Krumholzibacteriota bacterium]